MKRILWAVSVFVLAIGVFPVNSASAATNTNNFRISSYDIQYELSRDSEGRSVLKTTETIQALFPSYDQNRGIERAIPATYDNHPVDLNITSVTDDTGKELSYRTYASNTNTVLRIGDADTYVHGSKTYKISYDQRDVTRYFENTQRDEWYWDTNGTDWKVPIDALSVSIKIDPSLVEARVGEPSCYQGKEGGTGTCILNGEAGLYTVRATSLRAGENVTVAFGFKAGTFEKYALSPTALLLMIWGIAQVLAFPLAIILVAILSIIRVRRSYRMGEQNPIVAEYIPPKEASVIIAAQTLFTKQSVFTAQLIDLAVKRYISIIETRPKSLLRNADYDIEILQSLTSLGEEEREIITDMFGHEPHPGERLALKKLRSNISYSLRTMDNDSKVKKLITETYGIRQKNPEASKLFYRWTVVMILLAIVTLTIPMLAAAIVVGILGYTLRPLTDKGLALRRYVLGLDRYIKASETERLAFLQGPDTAQKVGYDIDPNNPGQIVKLYERVLPYAILFGREQQWSKRLGEFYEQSSTRPDWYTGVAAFNAASFASSMQSFSQSSTYSSGSSSSSGGSSGGGSSGGGGGGGGGGGW